MVIPVFSQGRSGPTRITIAAGVGGLRRDGVLFCEEVTAIDKDFLVRGPLGERVPATLTTAVLRAIRRAAGEYLPGQ